MPKDDVTYYYLTDSDLDGENIQEYDYIASDTDSDNPTLTLYTTNMDTDDDIYYKVYWMPLIPDEDDNGDTLPYNSLSEYWETVLGDDGVLSQEEMEEYGVTKTYSSSGSMPSDSDRESTDFDETTYFSGTTHPTDVVYDGSLHSFGTATIMLNGNALDETYSQSLMYYGGYYMVELYYERTKDAGTDGAKHFATVFVEKENSPENTLVDNSSYVGEYVAPNATNYSAADTIYSQEYYDSEVDDEKQSGVVLKTLTNYTSSSVGRTLISWYDKLYQRFYNDAYYTYNLNYTESSPNLNRIYNNLLYGIAYARKAYVSAYENSELYEDDAYPSTYTMRYLSVDEDNNLVTTDKDVTLGNYTTEISIYSDSSTGAYYPLTYYGVMQVMAENGDVRTYTTQIVQNGDPTESHSYTSADKQTDGEYSYDPTVSIESVIDEQGYSVPATNGEYRATVSGTDVQSTRTFAVTWTSSRVTCMDNANTESINVYFTETGSSTEVLLDDEKIAEYFNTITLSSDSTSSTGKFILNDDAPTGTYRIVPYTTYTDTFTQSEAIAVSVNGVETSGAVTTETDGEGNITSQTIEYTIPYTPFYIDNVANDDSYISSFNVSDDITTPYIEESTDFDNSDSRSVSILARDNSVNYSGYDDVKTVDDTPNVNAFTIYSYTKKGTTSDTMSMTLPYNSTLYVWVADESGSDTYNGEQGNWVAVTTDTSTTDDLGGATLYSMVQNSDGTYTYTFTVNFDEKNPYVGYYKVAAEDGANSTIYTVNVSPTVRNQTITLEVAHKDEAQVLSGTAKTDLYDEFITSGELYDEIIAANGCITATIKEITLDGDTDAYQTKIFDSTTIATSKNNYATVPYTYNLKVYQYDISADLPAGYSYKVVVVSADKSSYTVLADSQNYDGKSLTISIYNTKSIDLRIIITRNESDELWGVQHIWNFYNANIVDGFIQDTDGGYFYNYVYNKKS